MSDRLCVTLRIEGRVQGVGYRDWLVGTVERVAGGQVDGWVRNRADGTVEALLAGPAGLVNAIVARCTDGPPAARVDAVRSTPADPPEEPGFRRRPSL